MSGDQLPWVTACVPAYRSAGFIGKTLASLERQTYSNLRILVSVDQSDDDTEAVCRAYRCERAIDIVAHPRRLGWVANCNAALERVESELFFICPHDDLVLPDYVAALQRLLSEAPDAVAAYCDVQTFGKVEEVRSVTGLDGDRAERVCSLLSQRREGVPWRGLTRSEVLRQGLRMRDNPHAGFHSHVTWLVELLLKGRLLHHPAALYLRHERTDEHSVVTGWTSWTSEERAAAVAASTRQCFAALAEADFDEADWARVSEAVLGRFRRHWPMSKPDTGLAGTDRRIEMEQLLQHEADERRSALSAALTRRPKVYLD